MATATKTEKVSKKPASKQVQVMITKPNMITAEFPVIGMSPLVMHSFPEKVRRQIIEDHEAGSQSKKGKKKTPRDFAEESVGATHFDSDEGWIGVPASAIRAACISACRLVGFHMTKGKLGLFCMPDGFDKVDAQPLIKLYACKHTAPILSVRNANMVHDLRCRPMWRKWGLLIPMRFDGDMFSETDVANLLSRVGEQVGLLEGRHDSVRSNGMGWGTFAHCEKKEVTSLGLAT